MGWLARHWWSGRARRRLVTCALCCVAFGLSPKARAEQPDKLAIGFSNLVARLAHAEQIAIADGEYRVRILEALRAAGFNAVGAESLVFSRDEAERADLVLGGTIKELACQQATRGRNCGIAVAWDVLDVASGELAYSVLTRRVELTVSNDESVTTMKLVLGALQSLIARPRFKALLDQVADQAVSPPQLAPATFKPCRPPSRTLPEHFEDAADATVLIRLKHGFGSGFFLGADGLLLTAAHVAETPTLTIQRKDGRTLLGRVVRSSPEFDVALVSVDRADAKYPCLGSDGSPKQTGSDVYAIGAPASRNLAFSLTRGILSGLPTMQGVQMLQTDAPVSPGNSGGPLVNREAEVVGVVSRKLVDEAVEGVAFAVPIEIALNALRLVPGPETTSELFVTRPPPAPPLGPKLAIRDKDDPPMSLDPEGDAFERDRQHELQQLADWERKRPRYVLPLRYGGLVAAGVGSIGLLTSYAQFKLDEKITHGDYEDARLLNDLSWGALVLGGTAVVCSFVLDPRKPTVRSGPRRISLDVGASRLQLSGSF